MRQLVRTLPGTAVLIVICAFWAPAFADYANFESAHVHPIGLTPSGTRLLAVNTPDALLEVFAISADGSLTPMAAIPVGLEPVSLRALDDRYVWVVNHLSDSISVVDLQLRTTIRTIHTGDEPADVVFAQGKAFVAISQEDAVEVFSLADPNAAPLRIDLFSSDTRALAVSPNGTKVYAIPLHSGNRTTVLNAGAMRGVQRFDEERLAILGLNNISCNGPPPNPYPPLPPGIARNPLLTDPAPPAQPNVGLIVRWDAATSRWVDDANQNWNNCLPYRLPDNDLFIIDAVNPGPPQAVKTLGTTLFEVSVNPVTGRIYVPHTEARNFVRFEHALGVRGHMVDNRMAIVDPNAPNTATILNLNAHINLASTPPSNLAEREASISQAGMMVWTADGETAYLTAIGSRKLFRLDEDCLAAGCLFGPNRMFPDAVEVGDGPTGVALHEGHDRAYVLNRFSNSISIVEASSMMMLTQVPLHDPSSDIVKNGRHFLYDGIISSQHGDASCASCHVFGNLDQLAWDLGDPTGEFVPYGEPDDNVRFIVPIMSNPATCNASICAAHDGFDPQKGPMTTQTLRGMLEPLHWRGDRPTMNHFNMAFVGLMGTEDIGPINTKPAGLSEADMEMFRQFALDMRFPPNPYRNLDDTLPDAVITIPGNPMPGNPKQGEGLFLNAATDADQPCRACHAMPFGAANGKLGGVSPGDPASARAALFNGTADGSPHSDLKVPHLRNMYEKQGPVFGSYASPPDVKSGFGFTHDGAIPDMATFLSANVFTIGPFQARDLAMFQNLFPTGMKPSVGRQVTLPGGPPGSPGLPDEQLISDLVSLGNLADPNHHCDLIASTNDGSRVRTWYLNGDVVGGGLWTSDVPAAPQITTAQLRQDASGPITFLCSPPGSGTRMGSDRDEDGQLNAADCSDADPLHAASPAEVAGLLVSNASPLLSWDDQSGLAGYTVYYEVVGGLAGTLRSTGLAASTSCVSGPIADPEFNDPRPNPPAKSIYYYLVRARTPECAGSYGPGRTAIEPLTCVGL